MEKTPFASALPSPAQENEFGKISNGTEQRRLVAIMFTDMVGYSALEFERFPRYLGGRGAALAKAGREPARRDGSGRKKSSCLPENA